MWYVWECRLCSRSIHYSLPVKVEWRNSARRVCCADEAMRGSLLPSWVPWGATWESGESDMLHVPGHLRHKDGRSASWDNDLGQRGLTMRWVQCWHLGHPVWVSIWYTPWDKKSFLRRLQKRLHPWHRRGQRSVGPPSQVIPEETYFHGWVLRGKRSRQLHSMERRAS